MRQTIKLVLLAQHSDFQMTMSKGSCRRKLYQVILKSRKTLLNVTNIGHKISTTTFIMARYVLLTHHQFSLRSKQVVCEQKRRNKRRRQKKSVFIRFITMETIGIRFYRAKLLIYLFFKYEYLCVSVFAKYKL